MGTCVEPGRRGIRLFEWRKVVKQLDKQIAWKSNGIRRGKSAVRWKGMPNPRDAYGHPQKKGHEMKRNLQ